MVSDRRGFIKTVAAGLASAAVLPSYSFPVQMNSDQLFFRISLAQWSLHKAFFKGTIDNLEFPSIALNQFGIGAVEYVNQFFPSSSKKYARELLQRSGDAGVKNLLIMVDGEGNLGELYEPLRKRAVERHFEWIECAKELGCHSIRVNAGGDGSPDEVADAAGKSLRALCEFALKYDINVIVENHGGHSSNAKWLAGLISVVEMKNCGTLPDFANFRIGPGDEYDRYLGVQELMPFAKGVSAKSYDFDLEGNETHTDYLKMLAIVKASGYNGYVGIEYEGNVLGEPEGILATKELLLRTGQILAG